MRYVASSEINHADKLGAASVKSPKHLGNASRVWEYASIWIERSSLIKEPDFKEVNPSANDTFEHANQCVVSKAPVVVVSSVTEGTVEQSNITFHTTS